jgi:tRNA threonylcarbamoyladenosine biosynthesis protein TsaE
MVTSADEELRQIARRIAGSLSGGENLLLYGELGAGKTTFVQGLAAGFQVPQNIKSPTFTYLKEYMLPRRSTRLAHYDLYRLPEPASTHDLEGIELPDRLADPDVITVIEWAERLPKLPEHHHQIRFSAEKDGTHVVTVPDELYREVAG